MSLNDELQKRAKANREADEAQKPKKSKKPKPAKKEMTFMEEVVDTLKTVSIALAIALFVRFFFFQPFNIPSGSMKPNLLVGDFIVVSKPIYGYSKASFIYPITRLSSEARVMGRPLERGEIVVFKNERDKHKDYIKRLIALPGEKVMVRKGVVYINGVRLERQELTDYKFDCDYSFSTATAFQETMDNGVSYIVQECAGDRGPNDNFGPATVPEGHYFFMGDNRDNSQDSRTPMVRFVAHDQIVGRAETVVLSVNGKKSKIWEVWNWPGAIRWGRSFSGIK